MIAAFAALALAAAPTAPRAVAQAMFDAFNRHDAAAMQALYAPDARVTSSDDCQPMRGDHVQAFYGEFFHRFPDVRDDITTLVTEGEHVAVHFTASSKAGIAVFSFPMADFLTVRDGKILADDTLFDAGVKCGR